MPYKSKKQRAYLHIHEPALAEEWDTKYGGEIQKPRRERTKSKKSRKRKNKRKVKDGKEKAARI